jgi:hypothetical protein
MGNTIRVFRVSDLPNMGVSVKGFSYGFTVYRGVLIQWDEDEDRRILTFIDQLPSGVRRSLSIVQEHEGSLGLVWRNRVPEGYEVGREFEVEGDFWVVEKSQSVRKRQ